jgi:hypothetical protein
LLPQAASRAQARSIGSSRRMVFMPASITTAPGRR